MLAIYKREAGSYFKGVLGYALCAFFTAISALYFVVYNLVGGYGSFSYYTLYYTTIVFLLFVPILTMRSFAEEHRSKTDQLLLTSPVPLGGIVAGKFLAVATVYAVPCVIDCVMAAVLPFFGGQYLVSDLAGILCYFLMGCAAISVGIWCSAQTENPVLAAVFSFVTLLVSYFMPSIRSMFAVGDLVSLLVMAVLVLGVAVLVGIRSRSLTTGCVAFSLGSFGLIVLYQFRSAWLTTAFTAVLEALCLFTPFEECINGAYTLTAPVYYITVTALFLFLTAQTLEKRRWNG